MNRVGCEIEVVSLGRSFGDVVAVRDASLRVGAGEFLTLLGPSGSGKTTFLMMIAGFLTPSQGDIRVNGASIVARPPHKRDLGVVFQNYALFPHLTVFDNIAFPLRTRRVPRQEIAAQVARVLELVRLPGLEKRYPHQLSGGQQQRVALARALIFNPSALLMDEPLGALDKKLRVVMQQEIKEIQRSLKITTLYVTHDQEEAMAMSDRIAVFNQGCLAQVASPADLYAHPANDFVASFLGEANFLQATVLRAEDASFTAVTQKGLRVDGRGSCERAAGEAALLMLRPESIFLSLPREDSGASYEGIVEDVLFLGGMTRYSVRLQTGDLLNVTGSGPAFAEMARVGERVQLRWDPENLVVVARDSTA